MSEFSFDPEAALLSEQVAEEILLYRNQLITPELVEEIRERVAVRIGSLLGASYEINDDSLSLGPLARATSSQLEIVDNYGYRFKDLTDPNDIVVREHFSDFAHSSDVHARNFISAFTHAIDGAGIGRPLKPMYDSSRQSTSLRWVPHREPEPLEGIVVVKRTRAGLEPFTEHKISDHNAAYLAEYGMTAAGLLRGIQWNTRRFSPKSMAAFTEIGQALSQQLGVGTETLPRPNVQNS